MPRNDYKNTVIASFRKKAWQSKIIIFFVLDYFAFLQMLVMTALFNVIANDVKGTQREAWQSAIINFSKKNFKKI